LTHIERKYGVRRRRDSVTRCSGCDRPLTIGKATYKMPDGGSLCYKCFQKWLNERSKK